VTISGTDFAAGATVTIGGVPAENVVVVDPTTITARTAAHAGGLVDVTVTNPGDAVAATLASAVTYSVPVQTLPADVSPPPPPPGPPPQLPGVPSDLTSAVTGAKVTLAWQPPSRGGAPTTYVIEAGSFTGFSDSAVLFTGSTATQLSVDEVGVGT